MKCNRDRDEDLTKFLSLINIGEIDPNAYLPWEEVPPGAEHLATSYTTLDSITIKKATMKPDHIAPKAGSPVEAQEDIRFLAPDDFELDYLQHIFDQLHADNVRAGWWHDPKTGDPKRRNVFELMALIHSELSEALEGHRKGLMDDKLPHRPMVEVELADLFIRLADLAAAAWEDADGDIFYLDVPGAVVEKREYNRNRADHKPENRIKAGGKAV